MIKRDLPFGLFAWCFVVLVAAFMPWATSPVMFPFFGSISGIATGWTGNVNFLGMIVPNWLSVILAVALAVIGWLLANLVETKPKLSFWLALCGAGHALFFIASAIFGGPAQIGLGAIATFVSFVAILRLLKKNNTVASLIPIASALRTQPTSKRTIRLRLQHESAVSHQRQYKRRCPDHLRLCPHQIIEFFNPDRDSLYFGHA